MDSLREYLEHLLFAVLPYVAVVAFLVLLAARRYRVPPFRAPRPAPLLDGSRYGERLLFGGGLLVVLAGHVLGLLIPAQVLLWNSHPLRRYVLEVSALAFAVMTLVGLALTLTRCLFSAEARRGIGPAVWLLYALLLFEVLSGIFLALFYPWGSSWYATSAVPYLRSLVRLDPDVSYLSAMPVLVKLHLVTAWLLLMLVPFTRLVQPLLAPERDEGPARLAGRVTTAALLVGLTLSLVALGPRLWGARLPGNHQGYEPIQPIAFSHRLHAGELKMSCLYCHADAEKGRQAGIAAASICMNCHRFVTAPLRDTRAEEARAQQEKRPPRTLISAEMAKLYAVLGLNDKLQRNPARPTTPIRWVRVHNLPSYTRFDHRAHVNVGVKCQHCHGAVETMERVRQVEDLSMGWCVNCHRDANHNGIAGKSVRASNDCTSCHH
jgi:respiratory nitrate reductase gamma subunit